MKLTVLYDEDKPWIQGHQNRVVSSSPLILVMKTFGKSNVCVSQLASHVHPLVTGSLACPLGHA